jgi:selenide,water dikinase
MGSTMKQKDLVLIGGGHSHAIALKNFSQKPISGVRITLITDVRHTPYSGMLPGYVAGLYTFNECHIDLQSLTEFAKVRMLTDKAIGLDLVNNRVICANRSPVPFDLLSIDIGSTPATATVPGAAEHTIPVKPISKFLAYWEELTAAVERFPEQKMRIGIVGGGAGGVELALAVRARLQRIYRQNQQISQKPGFLEKPSETRFFGKSGFLNELHLFHRGAKLLPERNPWVGRKLESILRRGGVRLHLGESVAAVERILGTGEMPVLRVGCESGLEVECDRVFWVTQAGAASWLKKSGLATDDRGFILVNDALQSISHPQVFAAGDVATMVNHPRPKAGVFAVRQGQPLLENLQRSLLGKPLKPFVPQKQFLILVGTGDERAIASRGCLAVGPHSLLWRWKDKIDREFMERFANLNGEVGGDRG